MKSVVYKNQKTSVTLLVFFGKEKISKDLVFQIVHSKQHLK